MEFILSKNYAKNHFLTPLDLNLMCVRVKDPDGSGKGSGYWVGHFQISEELRKRKEAMEEAENLQSANADEEENEISDSKKFHPVLARFMHSSTPIPESFIEQRFCYVTAEMIFLSSPNRLVTISFNSIIFDAYPFTSSVSKNLKVLGFSSEYWLEQLMDNLNKLNFTN